MSDSSPSVHNSTAVPSPLNEGDSSAAHAVEVWKQVVAVQMHFNDIEMRIRNLHVTVLLGTAAATGWVLEKNLKLTVSALSLHYAVVLLLAGILASYLFYLMDRHWYHQLLRASVDQGRELDQVFGSSIQALGLTSAISKASPVRGFRKRKLGKLLTLVGVLSAPKEGEGSEDLHSTGKIELFYRTPIIVLRAIVVLSLLFGGLTYNGRALHQIALGLICG